MRERSCGKEVEEKQLREGVKVLKLKETCFRKTVKEKYFKKKSSDESKPRGKSLLQRPYLIWDFY